MARIVWSVPALDDLDRIADYIALDKPLAASKYVQKVFKDTDLLERFPEMGKVPSELVPEETYRELVIPPCRIFYRTDSSQDTVFIVHVMRGEQLFNYESLDRPNYNPEQETSPDKPEN